MSQDERFEVTVEAPLYPTESREAVIKAMLNMVTGKPEEIEEIKGKPIILRLRKRGHEALEKIRKLLREERILDTARSVLMFSLRRWGRMVLLLHKQAAYAGQLRICSDERESPLGAIRVELNFKGDAYLFLDWVAPKTVSGRVIKEVELQELIESADSVLESKVL